MLEQGITLLPADSDPYGMAFREWTKQWWKWLSSIPTTYNPTMDTSGTNVTVKQQNEGVLFLCQTIESTPGTITRKSRISQVRAIFMPVINWISISGLDGNSEEELISVAERKMDVVRDLEFEINGVRLTEELKNYRVRSGIFDIDLPEENIFDVSKGRRRAASDGYWVFFQCRRERINLSSFGSCSSGATRISVNYDLIVE